MITQDNYKIEIYSASADEQTDVDLGYDNGIYTWLVGGDILADNGISTLKRSVDLRTGGGIAQEPTSTATIVGGKYALILGNSPIVGKRFTVYNNDVAKYVGVITSVDVKGFESVLNLTVESKNREVTLPYTSSAIGNVNIDGTVSGDSGYIETLSEPCVLIADSVTDQSTYYQLNIKGGTATNVSEINRIIDDIDLRLSSGENVYYEGENGVYQLAVRTASGSSGVFPYRLKGAVDFTLLSDEVGKYGTILWSAEVFNIGLDGDVVVDGVTLDDVNGNIEEYNGGSVVSASDGLIWKSLNNTTDYDVTQDIAGGNEALEDAIPFAHSDSGVYSNYSPVLPSDRSTSFGGVPSAVVDKSSSTINNVSTSPDNLKTYIGLYGGYVFSMNGYKVNADKVQVVCDVDTFEVATVNERGIVDSFSMFITTKERANGTVIQKKEFTYTPTATQDTTEKTTRSTPLDYDNTTQKELYEPFSIDGNVVTLRADITDMFFTNGSTDYYDGVDVYVAIGYNMYYALGGTYARIDVKQVNIVEGYSIGREGLKDSQVNIDNSLVNGTIPLAYKDVCKRQNLFDINTIPPADGWGTEQKDYDGDGVLLDGNYITDTITVGALSGVMGEDITSTQLKKEIARSIPAVSFYNKDGIESLLNIGNFENNTNEILYTDVVGEVTVKAYTGADIQPTLLFEFGSNKDKLHITNVEQNSYESAYVVDTLGLSEAQKTVLWTAGHLLYEKHGTTTTQTVRKYPLVSDANGAFRVAEALYANMGVVNDTYYLRQTVDFKAQKSVSIDIGESVSLQFPMVSGFGVVSSVEDGVYSGTNAYTVDMIEAESIAEKIDILETGAQADNVLETGTQTDNIYEDGL